MSVNVLFKHELFEVAMTAVPLLVADLDTGEVLHATPSMESILGCVISGGLVGLHVEDLLPLDLREQHRANLGAYRQNPRPLSMGRELRALRTDGQEIGLYAFVIPAQLPSSRKSVALITVVPAVFPPEASRR